MLLKFTDFHSISSFAVANPGAVNAALTAWTPLLTHNNADPPVFTGITQD